MKTIRIAVAIIVLACVRAYAQDVTYLGVETNRVVLRDVNGRQYRLEIGDIFSDLGLLLAADDREAVFERALPEEERQELRSQGFFAPDIRRIRLPRITDD